MIVEPVLLFMLYGIIILYLEQGLQVLREILQALQEAAEDETL